MHNLWVGRAIRTQKFEVNTSLVTVEMSQPVFLHFPIDIRIPIKMIGSVQVGANIGKCDKSNKKNSRQCLFDETDNIQ